MKERRHRALHRTNIAAVDTLVLQSGRDTLLAGALGGGLAGGDLGGAVVGGERRRMRLRIIASYL